MCRELKIAEYIDARITNDSDVRNVTIGQAVVAMIINGLGFTGQTLYLFPEFFEDKPIDRLIGFKAALNSRYLVADASMYVAETIQLLDEQKQRFISRVPLNIKDAKDLAGKAPAMSLEPVEGYEDYYSAEAPSCYRYELKKQSRVFPNQKKKPCQNPTARWVFFCFQGISILTVNNQEEHVVGLKERQWTIIQILGIFYESTYSR